MSTDRKSAASTELAVVILAAPATMAQIRATEAYQSIASVEDATAIINDAIGTGTFLYGSGNKVTEFPSYYTLRFAATQEQSEKAKRPFHNATNSILLRAACCKVFENSPRPAAGSNETVVRTKTSKPDNMIAVAYDENPEVLQARFNAAVCEYVAKQEEYEAAQRKNLVENTISKLSPEQRAMLLAELLAAQ